MSERPDWMSTELEELRTLRDELRVRAHLGQMDARDRWEQAEKAWGQLESKLALIQREAQEPLHQVGEAARMLVEEIGEAYRHIRGLL